ncbi:E3 ubiquitin-protein ligase RNF217 [Chanos chanos]|uniref:E3 ubiquitin-protein ligase RNF217 n=1 Tax=Chanos chanos TaxID=29144 RepID=A0A6J2V7Y9_CHACN|nr:probable E3 ubiquitin-protein ligase RNF217 [Chanos chanos]
MEDDLVSLNVYKRNMPSFVDGEAVSNLPEVSREVGSPSTDFDHDIRDAKVQILEDFHSHEQKKNAENPDKDSFRKTTAVEILKINFGGSKSLTTFHDNNTEDTKDVETVDTVFRGQAEEHGTLTEDIIQCMSSRNEDIDGGFPKGLVTFESDDDVISDSKENRESKGTNGDDACQSKEHVYCTVYCIANDRKLNENLGDQENADNGTVSPSTSDVSVLPPTDSLEKDLELGQYSELYTLNNLVDSTVLTNIYSGDYNLSVVLTCRICLDDKHIKPLHCCKKAVCEECLKRYIGSQIRVGKADIVCPITECSGYLEESTVVANLASEEVAKYKYFLELSRLDSSTKPCPQCSLFTSLKGKAFLTPNRTEHKYKIQCTKCKFVWCFKCHSPWHEGLKCREYRKGDKLLRHWASVIEHGQRNAQKCPRCKIHIQRTEGCDHMTCSQCNTNFCYRCGEKYRHLRFFGDHTSNLSVFGCKYRYLPEKPHLRRLVRGSVCVSKMLVAPVVIVLVVVVGALALVIGLVAFPIYYVCKKRKKRSQGTSRWLC